MKLEEVLNTIEYNEERNEVTSIATGKVYSVDEFCKMLEDKKLLNKTDCRKLRSKLSNETIPRSETSILTEKLIEKYSFGFGDGIFSVHGYTTAYDDLLRFMWEKERLLPSEAETYLEDIERIVQPINRQHSIYEGLVRLYEYGSYGESEYLKSLYDLYPDIKWRELLYNIIVPNTKPMFHIFYDDGVGGTGKSTLLEVLTKLVGEDLVSNVLIDQFENRFMFSRMVGKYLNIGDDNGEREEISNIGTLKSIVTGNRVTVDRKFMQPIEVRIFAKQIFATNILPYLDFTDGGLMRRLNIVPMNKVIPKTAKMPVIDEEELARLFHAIVCHNPKDLEENDNHLAIENNPIYRFLTNTKPTYHTYANYKLFCTENGFKPMNITNYENKAKFVINYINNKGGDK